MREIKFRAFDGNKMRYDVTGFEHGHKNEMAGIFLDGDFYLINETEGHSPASMALNPSADVTQYTGLKDKNGVEIYEGDVLGGDEFILPVKYHKTQGRWFANDSGAYILWAHKFRLYKVIGNIYENQELLTEADK